MHVAAMKDGLLTEGSEIYRGRVYLVMGIVTFMGEGDKVDMKTAEATWTAPDTDDIDPAQVVADVTVLVLAAAGVVSGKVRASLFEQEKMVDGFAPEPLVAEKPPEGGSSPPVPASDGEIAAPGTPADSETSGTPAADTTTTDGGAPPNPVE